MKNFCFRLSTGAKLLFWDAKYLSMNNVLHHLTYQCHYNLIICDLEKYNCDFKSFQVLNLNERLHNQV